MFMQNDVFQDFYQKELLKNELRRIDYSEVRDQNNNVTYCKDSFGFEFWQTFDENNSLVHFKDSTGFEYRI